MRRNNYQPKERLPKWAVQIIACVIIAVLVMYAFKGIEIFYKTIFQ